jgi:hypothetical protein
MLLDENNAPVLLEKDDSGNLHVGVAYWGLQGNCRYQAQG